MYKTKFLLALASLRRLAKYQGKHRLSIPELARELTVSPSYLEQIFHVLQGCGFVHGQRGPGGGYYLAMPADSITYEMVYNALDEAYPDPRGRKINNEIFLEITSTLMNRLSEMSIGDQW